MLSPARSKWPLPIGILAAAVLLGLMSGCADESDSLTRPPDSTPPASTSLSINEVTPTTVMFTWRAPGSSGMSGRASLYDLRYSDTRFDETSFESALQATGVDAPSEPRSLERTTVGNLTPGQTYYFAIRTRDDNGNWSEWSPVINLALPQEEGFPVLTAGQLIHSEGTTATGFTFRVRWLVPDPENLPSETPTVVVGDSAFSMAHIPSDPPGNELYEYTARMPAGAYSFHFELYDAQDQFARLPDGNWDGPSVAGVDLTDLSTVSVPAGSFVMGNALPEADMFERPAHDVTLTRDLVVDEYEITNAQLCEAYNWALGQGWIAVTNDSIVTHIDTEATLLRCAPRSSSAPHGIFYSQRMGFTPMPFRENWPAAFVTWYGAAIYCNVRSTWDGYAFAFDPETWENPQIYYNPYNKEGWRLPSEAEWEYMASYDSNLLYPTGDVPPEPGVDGNFVSALNSPTDVGSFPEGATALGLLDLSGNVYEWCVDWMGLYSETAVTDPQGARSGESRIIRGGSWNSPPEELRCDYRFSTKPDRAYDGLGFRCVRSVNP